MIGSNETSSCFPISIERFLARIEPSYLRFSRAARIDLCAKKGTEKVSARRFFDGFVLRFEDFCSKFSPLSLSFEWSWRERVSFDEAQCGGTRGFNWRVALIWRDTRVGTLVNYKSAAEILSREIESAGIVEWELKEEVGKVNKHKVFFPSQGRTLSARVKPRLVNEYL